MHFIGPKPTRNSLTGRQSTIQKRRCSISYTYTRRLGTLSTPRLPPISGLTCVLLIGHCPQFACWYKCTTIEVRFPRYPSTHTRKRPPQMSSPAKAFSIQLLSPSPPPPCALEIIHAGFLKFSAKIQGETSGTPARHYFALTAAGLLLHAEKQTLVRSSHLSPPHY